MFEIIHETEDPVLSPEEARVQRAAELGDRLGRLEKSNARLRVSRIVGPGLLAVSTAVVALDTGDPVLVSIMVGTFVGILALYRWSAARLNNRRLLTEEEFDSLTNSLPPSSSSPGKNLQEPRV